MMAAALARAATLALQSLDASLAPLGAGLRMMLQRLRDPHGGEDSYYPPTLAFESLPLTRGRGTMLDSAPRRDAENDNADADDVDFFDADEHNDWGERRTDLGSALEAYARRRIAEFELLGSGIWFATPKRKVCCCAARDLSVRGHLHQSACGGSGCIHQSPCFCANF